MSDININNEYKDINNLTPFKCCVLQNFPFIEADFDAVTNYQLLCKVVEYLNKVIDNSNTQNSNIKQLEENFIILYNYVKNYFDNLDVQQEINKKLDEMAKTGELASVLNFSVLNVSTFISLDTNLLKNNNLIQTSGYYSINDGGAGLYLITNESLNDLSIKINDKYATLIVNNSTITPEQLGFKNNDNALFQRLVNYTAEKKLKLLLSNREYILSETINIKSEVYIEGVAINSEYKNKAIITNNNTTMFKLQENCVNVVLKNICFSNNNTEICIDSGDYALEWSLIEDCGFNKFAKTFNMNILGTRINRIWINYGNSCGYISGSDNIISNSFINTRGKTEYLLELGGCSLSRFENVYFTGKDTEDSGANCILKISPFSSNLTFNNCYFDYSNGSLINAVGSGSNQPLSLINGLLFSGCLFRGGSYSITTAKILLSYVRNVTFIANTFLINSKFAENDSTIFNFSDYSQGVVLINNNYSVTYKAINDKDIIRLEGYPYLNQNVGIIRNKNRIYGDRNLITTDSNGYITLNYNYSFNNIPAVTVSVESLNYYCTLVEVTNSIYRVRVYNINGTPAANLQINLNVIALGS